MRNKDVIALARRVHAYASPTLSPATLDALEGAPKRTREIGLSRPVALHVTYDLAEVQNDRLVIHPDVYGLAPTNLETQIASALTNAGYSPVSARVRVAGAIARFRKIGRASVQLAAEDRVPDIDAAIRAFMLGSDQPSPTFNFYEKQ